MYSNPALIKNTALVLIFVVVVIQMHSLSLKEKFCTENQKNIESLKLFKGLALYFQC